MKLAKTDWTTVASLKKLKDGEEARVFWPKEADSTKPIGYRYGRISVETIPGKVVNGTRQPDKRGPVFFEWARRGEAPPGNEASLETGRIELEFSKQVEVKREKSASGHSRRLG